MLVKTPVAEGLAGLLARPADVAQLGAELVAGRAGGNGHGHARSFTAGADKRRAASRPVRDAGNAVPPNGIIGSASASALTFMWRISHASGCAIITCAGKAGGSRMHTWLACGNAPDTRS